MNEGHKWPKDPAPPIEVWPFKERGLGWRTGSSCPVRRAAQIFSDLSVSLNVSFPKGATIDAHESRSGFPAES